MLSKASSTFNLVSAPPSHDPLIPCASGCFPIIKVCIDWRSSYHVRKILFYLPSRSENNERHTVFLFTTIPHPHFLLLLPSSSLFPFYFFFLFVLLISIHLSSLLHMLTLYSSSPIPSLIIRTATPCTRKPIYLAHKQAYRGRNFSCFLQLKLRWPSLRYTLIKLKLDLSLSAT